jgi:hypothetical protein
MRQIGRSCTCPNDGCLLGVEKVIDLGRERSHLVGKNRSKPGRSAGANGVKAALHRIERSQADDHLCPRSRDKKGGKERERRNEIGRETQSGDMDLSSINSNCYPDVAAAEVCRHRDRALYHEERGLARTGNRVFVYLSVR